MANQPAKVVVIQDGGRLHYALPVALQRAGMLERMYTNYYVKPHSPAAIAARIVGSVRPQIARRMLARQNEELRPEKVFSSLSLAFKQSRRRKHFASNEAWWEESNLALSRWALRRGFGDANAIMGFIRNIHPTLCAVAKQRGLRVVGDQIIAPMAVEQAEMRRQQERFPGWQREDASAGWRITERLEKETWPLADHITCASDYVREGLMAQGIDAGRITVLPYPIDANHFPEVNRRGRSGPVTVGFVGAVGLRKGAPYFFDVARRLAGAGIRFVMLGGSTLGADILKDKGQGVEIVGAVPRPEVMQWLARFDILLFPSTCEGSAGSVMEAMATGLPVVTSPNSGSVVRDGVEGFVLAYDDVEAMAARIESLARDAEMRLSMGHAARLRAESFNLDWYSAGLKGVFEGLGNHNA